MFCINCGATVDEESIFCTNCGKRIKADPVVTVAEQEAQAMTAAAEPVVSENAPVQPEVSSAIPEHAAAEPSEPSGVSYNPGYNEQPVMPYVPEKQQPEKMYFGKGALAFCLVIIGLLAISTGAFAGLYFSLL